MKSEPGDYKRRNDKIGMVQSRLEISEKGQRERPAQDLTVIKYYF